jgi:hypothetical protein
VQRPFETTTGRPALGPRILNEFDEIMCDFDALSRP